MRGLCVPVLFFSGGLAWPGLAPAGDLPFFASPKKRRPKKGEPKSGPLRGSLRCSRRGGNSQTCPLRGLRTCEFLIPTPLRCSARPHGKVGIGSGLPLLVPVPSLHRPSGERAGVRGHTSQVAGEDVPAPAFAVMRWRVAQGRADQGCACPKAAQRTSLRRPRPDRATQCARSEAQGQRIRLAFSLGTFFWRSKRTVPRPPGRDPAKPCLRRSKQKPKAPHITRIPSLQTPLTTPCRPPSGNATTRT